MSGAAVLYRDSNTSALWDNLGPLDSSTAVHSNRARGNVVRRESTVGDFLSGREPASESAMTDTASHGARAMVTLPARQRMAESSTIRIPQVLLAEWSGCVLAIEGHYFSAALKGIYGEGIRGEQEDAEIPVSDVGESDKDLLQLGNLFRLCVFYEIQENGQPRRYTQVIFRRLPAYRSHDLAKAAERASELHQTLRVE